MNNWSVLGIMLLMHFIADYTLQGILANMKQKSWWEKATIGIAGREKYRWDWAVALACHSLYWALLVCLPYVKSPLYLPLAVVNGAIHFVIDDLKANRMKINLADDQAAHLAQMLATWSVFSMEVLK